MDNPLIGLLGLFRRLLDEADEKMWKIIRSEKSKDIYIAAPDVMITLVNTTLILLSEQGYVGTEMETIDYLNRIALVPSADWALTLYHKDYSLYKQSWMLRKLALNTPLKCEDGNVPRHIIYANEWLNPPSNKVELN